MLHWLGEHWGDVVPAWLAVFVAAFFGGQAWSSSRQSKTARDAAKAEAERAERATKAAEDAAAAAQETATSLGRSAVAAETVAQDQADEAQQKPWDIARLGGDDFRLSTSPEPLSTRWW